jgi:autotransporter-associated beta strand protein
MTSVFGQITWVGPSPGNFGRTTNWSGGSPTSGTLCVFNGSVAGNVVAFSQDGIDGAGGGAPIGGSFGANGVSLNLTSGQTSPVNFTSLVAASVGMGFNGIQVDSGAGQLILGDGTANQLVATLRPSSGIHLWVNNSANPIIINPNVQIQNGGGTAHTINFQGTGDFAITNNIRNNNNAPANTLQWDSTGTTTWSAGGVNDKFNDGGLANVVINAGTVIVTSAGLLPITFGGSVQHNGTLLKFDAPGQSDTFIRAFGGTGPLQVNNGKWTFSSGASTFTGNILLTGGELVVNGPETNGLSGPLGVGGTISFTGGTLGFGVNNVFDYSSRFDTNAGQAYGIDTAGQNVTFTNTAGLTGTGSTLTKIGSGTLTLAGTNTYTGLTTVSFGKLVFQGPKVGTGNIIVDDFAALGAAGGEQLTPGTLTVGTNSGATLEFNNVSSTVTPLIAAGTVSATGTITINVNNGALAPAHSYPLFSWTSGSAPPVNLAILNGFIGNLSTNSNTIQLNVIATAYTWTGISSGSWDLTTANNWVQNGGPVIFANGGPVLFDDSLTANNNVTIAGLLTPTTVTVNNNNTNYTITSSSGNDIGGSASLTKSGNATLTLAGGANTYTGKTTISGGTLSLSALANGGSASDIGAAGSGAANLVLDGGVLLYTGGAASIDRLLTITTAGGTIDASGADALVFNGSGPLGYVGNGPRGLTLTGNQTNGNTLAGNLVDNGGPTTVTKNGVGKWVLTGTNTYSGVTTLAAGMLQVGAGGASGAIGSGSVVNDGSIDFNRTGTLTVSGTISGTGSVTNDGTGTVILANNNTYSGGTTINAGTLQVGNGGATGSLNANAPITNNSLLIFNTTGTFSYTANGLIAGSGNVIVRGSGGLIKAIGNNTYTGWTQIDPGATFQPCEGNQGALRSSVVTNNGTLKLVRQDIGSFIYSNNIVGSGRLVKDVNNNNVNDVTLLGVNTYSNGTIIAGGTIILGNGTAGAGSIIGNVIFTNSPTSQDVYRSLMFNHPFGDDVTFSGNITGAGASTNGGSIANAGQVVQNGSDTLTLLGNNTYLGGTVILNGTLQVGNGGTSGSIGTGTVSNNTQLVFNRSDDLTVAGAVIGPGAVVKMGGGTLTLSNTNISDTGPTTVSNGTLVVVAGTIDGDLFLEGGTFVGGGIGTARTNFVGAGLFIDSGTVVATLNTALPQSNTVYAVTGAIVSTGGALKLLNAGPAPVNGDKFTIFSQPVVNGGGMTIVSPGFTVQNNLAVDGSVTVTGTQAPPAISYMVSSNLLTMSWPASWAGGVHLQAQTNSISKGISTNWVTIAGTDASNSYSTTINRTNGCVFYRLIAP